VRLLHVARRPGETYLAQALVEAGHVVETATDIGEALLIAPAGAYDGLLVEVVDLAQVPDRAPGPGGRRAARWC
jgi:hypothetical protein